MTPTSTKLKKVVRKGTQSLPSWIKSIPLGSHGSGHLQKRLWKVCSDLVRIRDWYKYRRCVGTGQYIEHWSDGDAGHFISYSKCNGLFKFDVLNIALQSKTANGWGGQEIGHAFGEELKRRGIDPKELRKMNLKSPLKFTTQDILDKMMELLHEIGKLPEQPEWYGRVIEKI